MILDSSAVVAIIRWETEALAFAELIRATEEVAISAATVLEVSLVLGPEQQSVLDEFLLDVDAVVAPVDAALVGVARMAAIRYGRRSGSPAKLNFGDCFSYALAMTTGRPLLFKGNDFVHTDVLVAAPPSV